MVKKLIFNEVDCIRMRSWTGLGTVALVCCPTAKVDATALGLPCNRIGDRTQTPEWKRSELPY
jgi:hypothetical protein